MVTPPDILPPRVARASTSRLARAAASALAATCWIAATPAFAQGPTAHANGAPTAGHAGEHAAPPAGGAGAIVIPESIRLEHEEIHAALVAATKAPGKVGAAARELAAALHPHFVREEEIALPPLGLVAPLARRHYEPWMKKVLAMTDALRAELPRMLHEHGDIAVAARRLESVARQAHDAKVEQLARKLQLHARAEEEVYYPAALLVGDIVRQRAEADARPARP